MVVNCTINRVIKSASLDERKYGNYKVPSYVHTSVNIYIYIYTHIYVDAIHMHKWLLSFQFFSSSFFFVFSLSLFFLSFFFLFSSSFLLFYFSSPFQKEPSVKAPRRRCNGLTHVLSLWPVMAGNRAHHQQNHFTVLFYAQGKRGSPRYVASYARGF